MRAMVASKFVLVFVWNVESLDAGAAAVLMKRQLQIFEGAQNLVLRLVGLKERGEVQADAGDAIGNRDGVFNLFGLIAKEGIAAVAETRENVVLGVGETERHAKRVLHRSPKCRLILELAEPHFHRSRPTTR